MVGGNLSFVRVCARGRLLFFFQQRCTNADSSTVRRGRENVCVCEHVVSHFFLSFCSCFTCGKVKLQCERAVFFDAEKIQISLFFCFLNASR